MKALPDEIAESRRYLFNNACKLTKGNVAVAEDMVNQTMLKALTTQAHFKGKSSVRSWLYRILYNCFFDYTRRQFEIVDLEDAAILPSKKEHDPDLKVVLDDAFERVRVEHPRLARMLPVLVDGESYESIAAYCGIPIGTVKNQVHHLRKVLKEFLCQST